MNPLMLILIIGGGLALLLLMIGLVITATSEKSIIEERLGPYLEEEAREAVKGRGEKVSPVGDWLDRRLQKTPMGGGLARELARADLRLKPGEYIATMIISATGMGFVFWYFFDRGNAIPLFTALGAVLGWFLPRMYVRRQQHRRLIRFNDQLPDMLNLMVNGLRAGFSVMQAMEAVSKEMPSPISVEIRRVVQEMQLGLTMEQALENLMRRIPSDDLDLVITAINVQREVGGNLAEILDTISYTIRERIRIKGEIRVLTTQVMYSGRFLSILPVIIVGVLSLLNRAYIMEFFRPDMRIPGIIALSTASLLVISGYFVMTRIANIEV